MQSTEKKFGLAQQSRVGQGIKVLAQSSDKFFLKRESNNDIFLGDL